MNRIYVIVILTAVCCGCRRKADRPSETAEAPQAQSQHVYLGEPLEHWAEVVEGAQTDEELAAAVEALILAIEDTDVTAVVTAADAIGIHHPQVVEALAGAIHVFAAGIQDTAIRQYPGGSFSMSDDNMRMSPPSPSHQCSVATCVYQQGTQRFARVEQKTMLPSGT